MALVPHAALSQVVFVHEYLQLVFQDETLSVYNAAAVVAGASVLAQGARGFCDALVQLIGERVVRSSADAESVLVLHFSNGTQVHILGGAEAARDVEAFQYISRNGQVSVEQNA